MHLKKLAETLRVHLHFLIVMPLLIILMTWPTAVHVFDTSSFWLAQNNIDSNMLFWDAWYLKLLLGGQADFYYTDLLFHPTGVSLAFHNFSLPHMLLFAGFQAIMPASNAFNLTFLLLSFFTAAAGYVYLNYLFRDKWVALFGAVVFGASAFILSRPAHPNIAFIATIPLSLYFLHRGLTENSLKLLLIAGALIGATAFIGMYTLVCLMMMLLAYLLYFACRRWKERVFWLRVVLMLLVIAGFLSLRFGPMLADPQGLSSALSKRSDREAGRDLLGYFVNTKHPLTHAILGDFFPSKPFDRNWNNVVFLGYIPLLLAALAVARNRDRLRLLPWLLLLLPFLVLRLGSALTFNGVEYPHIVLPKYYLTELFSLLFKPFWATDNFHAGTLLPFAVLTCFGLLSLVQAIPQRFQQSTVLLLTVAVAFEYFQAQNPFVLPAKRLDFVDWMRQEEDQDAINLINVPFGPAQFKTYAFYQTYNGYPHVAGRPTRTPATAFDYINSNPILHAWQNDDAVVCLPGNRDEFIAAQEQLLADGFTHIVLHKYWRNVAAEARTLRYLPVAFEDSPVSIYRVRDLHLNCDSAAVLSTSPGNSIAKLYGARPLLPENRVSFLSIHSYEMTDGNLFDYYAALDQDIVSLVPLRIADLVGQRTSIPRLPLFDHDTALAANNFVLVAQDPRHTDQNDVDKFEQWVSRDFASCGILAESDSAVVALYMHPDFPCALANSADPLEVQYDNDAQLSNVVVATKDAFLELYFLWSHLPAERHSISIQFVNAAGDKVHNQDFVIGRDSLAHHRIDITGLAPGDYQVKMVLYNFETHASVSGTLVSDDTRFDRQLMLSTLTVE